MKRPEGFDKAAQQPDPASAKPRRKRAPTASSAGGSADAPVRPTLRRKSPGSKGVSQSASKVTGPTASQESNAASVTTKTAGSPRERNRSRSGKTAPRPEAAAKKQLRRAARDRRRAEKAELRRFTRRARTRKYTLLSVAGLVAVLLGLIAVAVFSPILALRTVVIDGTNRIDPTQIQAAVETQQGTPLALLDFDAIKTELSVFPLIRSYVTEIVPPDTLLVHIVEREPIGSITVNGVFTLVDPAGITIQESAERIPGVPLIDVGGADASSPAFAAVTEVLLSLPTDLRARVETVSATTQDDVSFVLSGVGQGVVWGSASDSARKAALLEALISTRDPDEAGEFDVSAPSNGIFRPN
ncbi:FtsQ-type POTRA domain-containing protein [Salinibacterium sp. SWN1162]|uniref:FtsQ-type POTRA domain-containing protein n=1 Tax=Salinibacterium sp. SWN1162 TaxID=2792053 RepID=UPI0027DD1B01|nr:FtsQ-type POTRA domain-containing protein [Salinibacterium sp. SWN1162]